MKYEIVTGCRIHKEIKLSFWAPSYIEFNIHKHLRVYFTKLRLSSHKLLVGRGRWIKLKVLYTKEDEHSVTTQASRINFILLYSVLNSQL